MTQTTHTTETKKTRNPRKAAAEAAAVKTQEVKKTPRKAVTATKAVAAPKAVTHRPAPAVVSQVAAVASKATKFFVFIEGARPVSGPRLAAHTQAALTFLGLTTDQSVRKQAAVTLMGGRAVKYHTEIGNLEEQADKVLLSAKGKAVFKLREDSGKVDAKMAAAFFAAITKGKASDAYQIKQDHLIPVGMSLR